MVPTANKDRDFLKYSETPLYDDLVITATFLGRMAKTVIHFLAKIKTSLTRPPR